MCTGKNNPLNLLAKGFSLTAWSFAATVLVTTSCYHFNSNTNTADVMSASDSANIVLIDSAKESFSGLFAGSTAFSFYKMHHFAPVWLKNKNCTVLADSMIQLIRSARTYGLLPQDYHLSELDSLLQHADQYADEYYIPKFDLLLTDAFFTMAGHLRSGRVSPDSLKRYAESSEADTLSILLLKTALVKNSIKATLESQEPSYATYHKLRSSLRQLLQGSDSSERQFLMSGHNLDTSRVSSKIVTLELNMERWKWERGLKDRYIAVNIPRYILEVVENDAVVFRSRVIVGANKSRTPVLDGVVRSFTIFPYWNVPRNIAVREILPRIKADSLYLQKHNYSILDPDGNVVTDSVINWEQYHANNFPFTVRQSEGMHNALGLIKFSFNNPYSVYLHDTNARLLFNREKRALSHGCVRVEEALELARYLVRDDNVYCSPEDLDQYLEVKKQLTIRIVKPIPVHLRYFTCDYRDGEVEYYQDVYGYDKALAAVIYQQPSFSSEVVLQ